MNSEQLLDEYSKEFKYKHTLTLEDLIESHRYLRSINLLQNEERLEVLNEARKKGYEQGKKEALEDHYISIERLRNMTLLEICYLIG